MDPYLNHHFHLVSFTFGDHQQPMEMEFMNLGNLCNDDNDRNEGKYLPLVYLNNNLRFP